MRALSETFIFAFVLSVLLTEQLVQSEEKEYPEIYPVCACPMQYKPVCDNNGKTHSNPCDLACTQKFVPGVFALCHTECPCHPLLVNNSNLTTQPLVQTYLYEDAFQRSCNCPRIYKPVCGATGLTYSNECMLECEHAKDSNIVKLFDGECAS